MNFWNRRDIYDVDEMCSSYHVLFYCIPGSKWNYISNEFLTWTESDQNQLDIRNIIELGRDKQYNWSYVLFSLLNFYIFNIFFLFFLPQWRIQIRSSYTRLLQVSNSHLLVTGRSEWSRRTLYWEERRARAFLRCWNKSLFDFFLANVIVLCSHRSASNIFRWV
jgi:hypothetical protein